MYNTTHTHEATHSVESTTMGTAIVSQVFTVDTDENGDFVQAEIELVEIVTPKGEPIKSLWAFIHGIQKIRDEMIDEIVAKAKADIHAERLALAETADEMDDTPESQLANELAALGVGFANV